MNFHHMRLGARTKVTQLYTWTVAPFNITVIELNMFAVMVVRIIKNVAL